MGRAMYFYGECNTEMIVRFILWARQEFGSSIRAFGQDPNAWDPRDRNSWPVSGTDGEMMLSTAERAWKAAYNAGSWIAGIKNGTR